MTSSLPLVSVLTPSLNQGEYLEDAIRSVRAQDYGRIEHVVVDGGSTDDTLEILARYPEVRWISEPDDGQADALNKGFRIATGDIFGWLNADDVYLPGAVSCAVAALAGSDAGLVYGGWRKLDDSGALGDTIRALPFDLEELRDGRNVIAQPTAFFTRRALEVTGGFDPEFHYAMDYDLWLKIATRFPVQRLDTVMAGFRFHAESKTSSQQDRFFPEVRRISRKHGGRFLSDFWLDRYLPRHRPRLYRVMLFLRLVKRRDFRGLFARVARRLRSD